MEDRIEILSDLKIVKVTLDASSSYVGKRQLYSDAVSELKINRYHRLLFDSRNLGVPPNYTTENIIDKAEYMNSVNGPKNLRVALLSTALDAEAEASRKNFIIFARIINDISIEMFKDYDTAIQWLTQE